MYDKIEKNNFQKQFLSTLYLYLILAILIIGALTRTSAAIIVWIVFAALELIAYVAYAG